MQSQVVQWLHITHPTSTIKTCIHNNLTLKYGGEAHCYPSPPSHCKVPQFLMRCFTSIITVLCVFAL